MDDLLDNKINVYSKRLKMLRTKNNLTQIELARNLKCANSLIGQVEKNLKLIDIKLATRLASFFNTTIDYWIDTELELNEDKLECEDLLIKDIKNIIKDFESADLIKKPADVHEPIVSKFLIKAIENYLLQLEINKLELKTNKKEQD